MQYRDVLLEMAIFSYMC